MEVAGSGCIHSNIRSCLACTLCNNYPRELFPLVKNMYRALSAASSPTRNQSNRTKLRPKVSLAVTAHSYEAIRTLLSVPLINVFSLNLAPTTCNRSTKTYGTHTSSAISNLTFSCGFPYLCELLTYRLSERWI